MGHKGGYWLVHEECIVQTNCGVPKGRSDVEQEKIKPIALAVIKLRLSEEIRRLVS